MIGKKSAREALYESIAILAYLEVKYPKHRVLGRTPEEIGSALSGARSPRSWRTWSPGSIGVCIPIYRGTAARSPTRCVT